MVPDFDGHQLLGDQLADIPNEVSPLLIGDLLFFLRFDMLTLFQGSLLVFIYMIVFVT